MNRLSAIWVAVSVVAVMGSVSLSAQDPVKKGQDLYTAQKCSKCHKVGSAGGKLGPDLSNVGAKRDEAWLKTYLVNPKSVNPKNVMPAVKVPEADLKALMAYLLTLKTTK